MRILKDESGQVMALTVLCMSADRLVTKKMKFGGGTMRLYKDEEGQVLILTVLCMTVFFGFLALAVDVGMLFNTKRQLQITADAAATAAAVQYVYGYVPSATVNTYSTANAIAAGTAAGLANDPNINTPAVTVNANPASPAVHRVCSGSTCYFEAIITKDVHTVFFGAFYNMLTNTSANTVITVGARAVAGTPGPAGPNCTFLTDPTGLAISARGSWGVVSNCGMYINSNSGTVETSNGKAGGITASSISMVGLPSGSDGLSINNSVVPQQVLPESIPFGNITPPTPTGCVAWANQKTPGCYNMPTTGKNPGGTVTGALASGIYIFTGNVSIKSVTGTGICLDINDGSLEAVSGNGTSGFTPPTTGEFSGIAIYMPPSNANSINFDKGADGFNSTGWIVAPGATFSMQDNGSSATVGGLIVDNINTGPSTVTITGSAGSASPIKIVSLVE